MPKRMLPPLSAMLLCCGCALFNPPPPVAASCPPPPPAPQAVLEFATPTGTSLIEESANALIDFQRELSELLKKASGESM